MEISFNHISIRTHGIIITDKRLCKWRQGLIALTTPLISSSSCWEMRFWSCPPREAQREREDLSSITNYRVATSWLSSRQLPETKTHYSTFFELSKIGRLIHGLICSRGHRASISHSPKQDESTFLAVFQFSSQISHATLHALLVCI